MELSSSRKHVLGKLGPWHPLSPSMGHDWIWPNRKSVWPIACSMWPFLELFSCVESGLQAAELFLQSDFIPRGPNTILYKVAGNALLMWLKCSPLWDECVSSRLSSVQMLGSHDEHCANRLLFERIYLLWSIWSSDRILVLWLHSERTRIKLECFLISVLDFQYSNIPSCT